MSVYCLKEEIVTSEVCFGTKFWKLRQMHNHIRAAAALLSDSLSCPGAPLSATTSFCPLRGWSLIIVPHAGLSYSYSKWCNALRDGNIHTVALSNYLFQTREVSES